jgi:predicted CXXCH cytochrome family protein
MDEATEKSVLGNFDNATFSKDGIESKFFKKDGKYWVNTDGPDGKLADFEIRYTFGITPLQQYLIELKGGRLQALGVAWDSRPVADGGQRWYHLYPDRKLAAGDPLHWTGIDQNWNYQCAYCHSTNLRKNFDPASEEFKTTWSEMSVGCEACHGPASKHLSWAMKSNPSWTDNEESKGFSLKLDERQGVTWRADGEGKPVRSTPRTTDKELNVCAACHARRQQFSEDPKTLGHLFDAFRPAYLEADLYHADGQQRQEVYTHGSFSQSKMHAAGITCSDCHNPHSGKLRQSGNAVCTQCHVSDRYETASHHHHAQGSKGSECAACHMPAAIYMGVDARHDHSLRIPRPDRTVNLATPNACNQCHIDKSAMWASDAIKSWVASPKSGAQDFAEAFDLGDRGAPGAQVALLKTAQDRSGSAIARASAMARLSRFPSAQVLAQAEQSLKSDDPFVRLSAIPAIAGTDPATRRKLLAPLLSDKARLVRMDAARALAGDAEAEFAPDVRSARDAALAEYIDGQLFNAERPESHANLGALFRDQGRMAEARRAFEKAMSLDASFIPAAISLAELVRSQGNESDAEKILRNALAANPNSGPLQHALGLSLIRQAKTADAIAWLANAAKNSPEDPRFAYVYSVALHDTGKPSEAVALLKNALARHPYDRELLWTLASYEVEMRDYPSALERMQLLTELEPERVDFARILASLKSRAR